MSAPVISLMPRTHPIVAVHGSASTGGQWRRLAEEMGVRHTVLTPDLPGYGTATNALPEGAPSLDGDGAILDRIAEEAGQPLHLVGHSFGAAIALAFALRAPRAVASLVLIEPALFHLLRADLSDCRALFREISGIERAIRDAILTGDPAAGMARFVDYWNGDGAWDSMKPSLQAALAAQCGSVRRNFQAGMAESWHPYLCRRLTCPVTMISMEKSRGPAIRATEIVAEAIPQARHIRVPDAGHMAPVTHKGEINALIAAAIASAEAGCAPGLQAAA